MVGDNEPYAVSDETDYTIPVHGEARGLMNTGIEIRQDLIADAAGQQQWAERLATDFWRDRNGVAQVGAATELDVRDKIVSRHRHSVPPSPLAGEGWGEG